MNTVSVRQVSTYRQDLLTNAVRGHFDDLGGISRYVRPGMRVLLKTNLLMARAPETATTTHPLLVEAVAAAVREAGGQVTIADSPGGPYTPELLRRSYRVTGLEQAAECSGAALNFDVGSRTVEAPDGVVCREFEIIEPWFEADLVLSVCKLKTHAMTAYTGAVKNCFGLVPGLLKPGLHFRFQQLDQFCQMLIDLCCLAAPALTFMDAVVGMEGNGPSGGSPRPLGLTLCSPSPFALDLLASHLIGYRPEEVATVRLAAERGLCPASHTQLQLLGDDPAPYACRFARPDSTHDVTFSNRIPKPLQAPLRKLLAARPHIDTARCIGCGECAASCPPQTIRLVNGKAVIDKKECIRCFCCQEMCPVRAIEIRQSKLFRLG
ncbi:MAG: DUF362 domain-containing protein [Clostridia bacterium]|nr:DUF362 domain-containing protein [Clostridia bacterium]MBQ3077646.1 DUF362 domain-containing protein [Clostridia bacterium]